MQHDTNLEMDWGLERRAAPKEDLLFVASAAAPLNPAQIEFNRQMKRLENARAKHERERVKLDQTLVFCIRELMPLIEDLHRANRDLVFATKKAMDGIKLTARRREWLQDLVGGKASGLIADPVGLSEEDMMDLQAVVDEFGPSLSERQEKEMEREDFDFYRMMLEAAAREAGVDINLDGLDIHGDPEEFERQLHERLGSASEAFERAAMEAEKTRETRERKPSKAKLEKERKLREQEEAKTRDFKSLFKQLAKALHPDLETDPTLKVHKEVWMKRLTSAYENGDLHDMLRIEMEWLGEEAENLANASEEKLKVYGRVIKEQIADLKRQTEHLPYEPQYGPLSRFRDPYFGDMKAPTLIRLELLDTIENHHGMLKTLEAGSTESRKMLNAWADAHARASRDLDCPF